MIPRHEKGGGGKGKQAELNTPHREKEKKRDRGGREKGGERGGERKLTANADNGAIGANVAAFPNDQVSHGRVEDHAVAVDEGGARHLETSTVVNPERRLDKRDGGLEGRVGDGLVVGDHGALLCRSTIRLLRTVGLDNATRNKTKKNVC